MFQVQIYTYFFSIFSKLLFIFSRCCLIFCHFQFEIFYRSFFLAHLYLSLSFSLSHFTLDNFSLIYSWKTLCALKGRGRVGEGNQNIVHPDVRLINDANCKLALVCFFLPSFCSFLTSSHGALFFHARDPGFDSWL